MSSPRSSSDAGGAAGREPGAPGEARRRGDAIAIAGDYQHRALLEGPAVQRYWHQAKLELLDWLFEPARGEAILDVGCGSGVFANQLASFGAQVLAVDGNPDAIRYATATFARDGLEFREAQLDELDLPDASFDRATCLEVIEHVYPGQVRELLTRLRHVLRPGGSLLVTTPNYRGMWPLVEWATDRFAPAAQMDRDQHVTRFSRPMLREFLTEAGFDVVALRSYCTAAPFLAPLSWSAARRLDRLERVVDLPFGNLLAAVARVPGDPG